MWRAREKLESILDSAGPGGGGRPVQSSEEARK